MTPEERNMLTDLANKVAQTPAPPRDAEAEDLIRTRIGVRPDALYIMTQTVLMQGLALQQAQRQIQELQQRGGGASPISAGSFLGGGQQQGYSSQQGYAQQQSYSQPPPLPQYQQVPSMSGGGGFLRGAAQTAAGVAAGALAFEGISSLFHGIEHGFGGGGYGGDNYFGGGGRPEETVINNYYDSPGGGGGHERSSFLGGDDTANTDYGAANSDDSQFADDSAGAGLDDTSLDDSFDSGDDTFA